MKKEKVKKAAERFEQQQSEEARGAGTGMAVRSRSRSIGSNLYRKLMELEEDRDRIAGSLAQSKAILPWREHEEQQQVRANSPGSGVQSPRMSSDVIGRVVAARSTVCGGGCCRDFQ